MEWIPQPDPYLKPWMTIPSLAALMSAIKIKMAPLRQEKAVPDISIQIRMVVVCLNSWITTTLFWVVSPLIMAKSLAIKRSYHSSLRWRTPSNNPNGIIHRASKLERKEILESQSNITPKLWKSSQIILRLSLTEDLPLTKSEIMILLLKITHKPLDLIPRMLMHTITEASHLIERMNLMKPSKTLP